MTHKTVIKQIIQRVLAQPSPAAAADVPSCQVVNPVFIDMTMTCEHCGAPFTRQPINNHIISGLALPLNLSIVRRAPSNGRSTLKITVILWQINKNRR